MPESKSLYEARVHPDYKKAALLLSMVRTMLFTLFFTFPFIIMLIITAAMPWLQNFDFTPADVSIIAFVIIIPIDIIFFFIRMVLRNKAIDMAYIKLSEDEIIMKYGALSTIKTSIPYENIVNYMIRQGIFERKYDLYSLIIMLPMINVYHTDSGTRISHTKVVFPGLKDIETIEDIIRERRKRKS